MKTKIRRTESEWRKIIKEWIASRKSQHDFCKQSGIPLSSFCRWRRKLKGNNSAENSLVKIENKDNFSPCNILIQTNYCKITISGNENTQTLSDLFCAIRKAEYVD